tara:strand:+ start:167 stop:817 length:651 start_codon:yes stop_codon:yes gene_type:complete
MDEHQQTDEQFVYTFHNELLPSQVDAFNRLQANLDDAAKAFDGYLGQELSYQDVETNGLILCTARIRFTSLEHCLSWLDSTVRRHLLLDAEAAIGYRYRAGVEPQSFDQWISVRSGQRSPTWKVNLLVWLALYPSVMVLILIGQTTLGRLPLPLNMLISNAITVAVTGWWLVPWLSRVYGGWLSNRSQRWNWIHSSTIVGFLLLFLVLFSALGSMF